MFKVDSETGDIVMSVTKYFGDIAWLDYDMKSNNATFRPKTATFSNQNSLFSDQNSTISNQNASFLDQNTSFSPKLHYYHKLFLRIFQI